MPCPGPIWGSLSFPSWPADTSRRRIVRPTLKFLDGERALFIIEGEPNA